MVSSQRPREGEDVTKTYKNHIKNHIIITMFTNMRAQAYILLVFESAAV
jgi:hypothetical protein